jgi:hypothetical protein
MEMPNQQRLLRYPLKNHNDESQHKLTSMESKRYARTYGGRGFYLYLWTFSGGAGGVEIGARAWVQSQLKRRAGRGALVRVAIVDRAVGVECARHAPAIVQH